MALVGRTSIHGRGLAAIAAAAIFTALAVVSFVPAATEAQPAASDLAASADGEMRVSRKGKRDGGIRGHGFVRDGDVFTTIDAPGVGSFAVAFGIDNRGRTVGGYADDRGRLHGFLKDKEAFTVIDFPGARGTVAFKINDSGQIVGAYGTERNIPATELPYGFLLDNGIFTPIDVPGAVETRPYGINNVGQIVGEYVDQEGRSHGFLLDNGVFTTIDAPDSTSTFAIDIDDSGRIVGRSLNNASPIGPIRGFLRDAQGVFLPIDAPAAPPPPGRPELPTTQPSGLNNLGQVTGVFTDSDGTHAFVLDNGVFTTIAVPVAVGSTIAFDINDSGQVAGAYDVVSHGVLQDRRGNFTTLDHPDAVEETVLSGINNRGQIVGGILDATNTLRSVLYDRGRFTTLEIPGALGSAANKINDHGQIVGAYSTLTNRNHFFPAHGYLWDKGVVTTVDVPGAQHTHPSGINNHGQIVGGYLDAAGNFQSFLREPDGTFTTIQVPGAVRASVSDIDDEGRLIGEYLGADGKFHGFLLDQGVVTIIDPPGATAGTSPRGFNKQGQVVGVYFDDSRAHGFVFSNGRFTTFTAPGAVLLALPFDIDDHGRIVGVYQ
jgi:probable HAF family extracellular repeat protein